MTLTRYFQLAASPGLFLPGLHPHLQGLPGFPVGSQMVPNGTIGERFLIPESNSLVPSICQRQLCVAAAISLPTVNFFFPCVSGAVPGPMGIPNGQLAAHNHDSLETQGD